jgi:rhodanese-related sulfurtransferase
MNQITVAQLHDRLQTEKNLHILDVREQNEYDENNIGARLWPLSKLNQMDAEGIEDWQDEEIIVHCRSGQRSMQACMLLESMGFSQLTNLKGGIKEWQEKYGSEKIG